MKKIRFIKEYRAIKLSKQGVSSQTFKYREGDVLDEVLDEEAQWLIDNGFAEEVKESGWWKPKYGEEYFYVGLAGSVHSCIWTNDGVDNGRLKLGYVFKTKEAAERYRDYLKAIATVRQDEGVLTPKEIESADSCGGTVWCIAYTFDSGLFVYTCHLTTVCPQIGAIYFTSRGYAEASLDEHPDEWKIIANYDWSRE